MTSRAIYVAAWKRGKVKNASRLYRYGSREDWATNLPKPLARAPARAAVRGRS